MVYMYHMERKATNKRCMATLYTAIAINAVGSKHKTVSTRQDRKVMWDFL